MMRAVIYKWRQHGTVVNLPRSGRLTREQQRLIQEVIKELRTASNELQASPYSAEVRLHDSTKRKRKKLYVKGESQGKRHC